LAAAPIKSPLNLYLNTTTNQNLISHQLTRKSHKLIHNTPNTMSAILPSATRAANIATSVYGQVLQASAKAKEGLAGTPAQGPYDAVTTSQIIAALGSTAATQVQLAALIVDTSDETMLDAAIAALTPAPVEPAPAPAPSA
jgi:hypothetical protein